MEKSHINGKKIVARAALMPKNKKERIEHDNGDIKVLVSAIGENSYREK